jgi:hypothetical protein
MSDAFFPRKVTAGGEENLLCFLRELGASIDHCGTLEPSAIDSAHRATETENENAWQRLPA